MAGDERFPKDFEKEARKRFAENPQADLPFEAFFDHEKVEFLRRAALAAAPSLKYTPGLPTMTICGNGDFLAGVNPAEWQGANGSVPLAATNPFANFTVGLNSGTGSLTDPNSHQTWTPAGTDPLTGIPTTAQGSPGAVRIGNAFPRYGCELLSKTFVVTSAQSLIRFWYAVVLQDPGDSHPTAVKPFFWVRVTDTATDTVVPGAVNLGNGSDMLIADTTNPFFDVATLSGPLVPEGTGEPVAYKIWTCAQINLASRVGRQVTVEFVTGDCGYGAHFGYAYVDNWCGNCAGSPAGNISFDAASSSKCGKGQLCFNYSLPTHGHVTGTATITLDIYQDGVLMNQLVSPVLTTGNRYCFAITPSSLVLNPNLNGFDFVATANFAIGTTLLAPMLVGAPPTGVTPGQNNDYQVACESFSYAVKFVCGEQPACGCECTSVRPGVYSTEINIYNHTVTDATIRKRVIPVVIAGAPAGREPHVVRVRAEESLRLPSGSATMDDCCRIIEMLLGAPPTGPVPITIGYLEIVSPVELSVTAVYTATALGGGNSISIDVEQINPKIIRQ